MPGAHPDPAVEVPHGQGRHLGENTTVQPLFPGHLVTEECIHCSPQRRLCCRMPLGDHRRQTVKEEVARSRSLRWLWGRACRSGNLQKKAAGSGQRTSDAGCHPGVKVALPGKPDMECFESLGGLQQQNRRLAPSNGCPLDLSSELLHTGTLQIIDG